MTPNPGVPREPHERPPREPWQNATARLRLFIFNPQIGKAHSLSGQCECPICDVDLLASVIRAGGELGGLGASPPEGPWKVEHLSNREGTFRDPWQVVLYDPTGERPGQLVTYDFPGQAEAVAVRDALNAVARGGVSSSPSEESRVSDDELSALRGLADVVNSMMYAAPETRPMWDEELTEAHAALQAVRRGLPYP